MFEIVRAFRDAFGIDATWSFVLIVALFFAATGGGVAWIVDRAYRNAITSEAKPIVLEWSVSAFENKKTVTTHNRGTSDVRDLAVQSIKWVLDAKAWTEHRIEIANYSVWSGGAVPLSKTLAADASHVLDLTVKRPFIGFELLPFASEKVPDGSNPLMPVEFLTFYSLRFTFRDARTGERYHHYEVISAQANTMLPINAANPEVGGGGGWSPNFWVRQLEPTIIAAAEQSYQKDNSRRYPE